MKGFQGISSTSEDFFAGLSHYGPVTSLKIFSNYILCGYGPTLKIFEFSNNQCKLISSQKVFKRNKIHSISVTPDGDKVIVAGARSFSVLKFNNGDPLKAVEKAVNEWIIAVEFLDPSYALLLTSHNTIYKVDISDMDTQKFKLEEILHCNEKSILYSGSIRVGKDKVIVSAGTVMDGTIIWDMNSCEILHTLTEHKGSIFGVKVDKQFKYITSCSDDRSIKFYDFESGKLLAEGWGHGARIWNLEFFESSPVRILSSSEDCTARVWEYQEGSDRLKEIEVIDDCHLGKHVWSCDVDYNTNKLAVTGGADGKIRIHDLSTLDDQVDCYSMKDISDSNPEIKFEKPEVIKHISELPLLNYLVALTSLGQLVLLDQSTNKWYPIELSKEESDKISGFAVVQCFATINVIFVMSKNGELLKLQFKESIVPTKEWIEDKHLSETRASELVLEHDSESNTYFVLTASPNTKMPFSIKQFKLVDNELQLTEEFTLDQPQQTRFTVTSMIFDKLNNWLILGSRYVSMMVFDLNTKEGTMFKKISSGDTITSISFIEQKKDKVKFLMIIRDGIYMYVELTRNEGHFNLEIIHQNKISRGFIEGGFLKNNELIFYGFRSSYFYVWNDTKQIEITKELCGGSHRLWGLFTYENKDIDFKYAYINKSKLYIKKFADRFTKNPYGVLDEGTHGREIRDIAISSFSNDDGTKNILTASEDTVVRLGTLNSEGKVKYHWCMHNHISGLQKVKFLSKKYAASSSANEEFFIWKLDQLNGVPLMTQYATLKPSSEFPDLRIMAFDSLETPTGFKITTAYSDSHIKVWDFNSATRKFTLLTEDFYTTCCLLNIQFLKLFDELHILTSATDGHIAIWNVEASLTTETPLKLGAPIIKQQLHQNGTKGLILCPSSEGEYDLVTGGDDNALLHSRIKAVDKKIVWESVSFVEGAASSTITSISPGGDHKALVTSVDQIVRMWDFKEDLKCVSAIYTTVADTGSSDTATVDGANIAVVGGAGLSVWKY